MKSPVKKEEISPVKNEEKMKEDKDIDSEKNDNPYMNKTDKNTEIKLIEIPPVI
jgi:hypothetical protein